MFYFLLWVIIAVILCIILYRKCELYDELPYKEQPRWYKNSDDVEIVGLYFGRIFWPITLPCYLMYLVIKFLIKKLYNIISKFVKI
jgi:hypothetical protein